MYRIISLPWALLAAAFMLLMSHVVTLEATRISISSGGQIDSDRSIKKQLPQRNEEHQTPSTMPSIVYEWDTNEERFVMVGLVDADSQIEYETKAQRNNHVIHDASSSIVHDFQKERSEEDQGIHGIFQMLRDLFRK